MLDALAGIAAPGDSRTKQQRRADALVDVLMGRISNGWQPGAEEGEPDELDADAGAVGGCDCSGVGGADPVPGSDRSWDYDDWDLPASAFRPDPTGGDDRAVDPCDQVEGVADDPDAVPEVDPHAGDADPDTEPADQNAEPADPDAEPADPDAEPADPDAEPADQNAESAGGPSGARCGGPGCSLPPSGLPPHGSATAPRPAGGRSQPPPRVNIGVVVSIQSLFGFTDTPGELADGSAHVPAAVVRELAGQPGTLFYRLLTDPTGNLLDVTELGQFPSRKLATAIRFRDGVCTNPVCHVPAHGPTWIMSCPTPKGRPPARILIRNAAATTGPKPVPDSPRQELGDRRSGPHPRATTTPPPPIRCPRRNGRPTRDRAQVRSDQGVRAEPLARICQTAPPRRGCARGGGNWWGAGGSGGESVVGRAGPAGVDLREPG